MTNLFSVFDPCTGLLSLNWLSTFIFMMLMPYKFWLVPNKHSIMISLVLKSLNKEIKMLMPYKGVSLIMLTLFLYILVNNLMGLLPYVFTSSSHLIYSLSLALPLWISLMIYGWINKYNSMFSHLVPTGTPPVLMPFMVMIETVSNLIRPGSLSVRLTANMIAGHLLMSLLGNNTGSLSLMISAMIVYVGLMVFELAVAMIQAYVFMTLTTLYSSEI
uniref:ATP synthase subunit a n=1 Tax=Seriana sp. 'barna' TaxID=3003638 RepID=A0A9E9EP08_9HEMI|nr:ATP synthase F0 subunit 6 [Seriana bacilla]WAM61615.1 ATP synthase F0 subunit 6 [Seriana sp. 'barna']WOR80601.1 ATP synthase F0 subunit 6 [Seriana bacilla]